MIRFLISLVQRFEKLHICPKRYLHPLVFQYLATAQNHGQNFVVFFLIDDLFFALKQACDRYESPRIPSTRRMRRILRLYHDCKRQLNDKQPLPDLTNNETPSPIKRKISLMRKPSQTHSIDLLNKRKIQQTSLTTSEKPRLSITHKQHSIHKSSVTIIKQYFLGWAARVFLMRKELVAFLPQRLSLGRVTREILKKNELLALLPAPVIQTMMERRKIMTTMMVYVESIVASQEKKKVQLMANMDCYTSMKHIHRALCTHPELWPFIQLQLTQQHFELFRRAYETWQKSDVTRIEAAGASWLYLKRKWRHTLCGKSSSSQLQKNAAIMPL
jgi:hypothetical protein